MTKTKTETKQATFTFSDFTAWKEEFKSNQKFNAILNTAKNTTGKVKSRIVETTKKVLEMKVIKAISNYADKHPVMVIITLWILSIVIMGSLLMGSITAGLIFTIYLTVYTIMYFLLYHLLVIFAGLATVGIAKAFSAVKKSKGSKKDENK